MGAYPSAVLSPGLPENLRMAAHVGGIDKAIADVRGLRDPPYAGGRRRNHRKSQAKRSKKNRKTHKRRRGGALGYAPFPSNGMLLDSSKAYAQAGLNPEWKTDVAFTDAKIRESQ
jgi:hypothetical protein